MAFIDYKELLRKTDGGLDIIKWLYSHCKNFDKALKHSSNHFQIRPEDKTCSANLFNADGVWLVTDFGGDAKSKHGIQCYMVEYSCDFSTALNAIALHFGLIDATTAKQIAPRAETSSRPANEDEKERTYSVKVKKSYSNLLIETLISKKILKHLHWDGSEKSNAYNKIAAAFKKYNIYELESYTYVKDRQFKEVKSTETFPIVMIDEGALKKIYSPKAEKQYRFMWLEKPSNSKEFYHGVTQLRKDFESIVEDADFTEDETKEKKKLRLNAAIICSGMSDAINLYLADPSLHILWGNAEQNLHPAALIRELRIKAEKIYQLYDSDKTGKEKALNNAFNYTDILTVELPEKLSLHRDFRGNTCKDVRDFFNHYSVFDFNQLLLQALPLRIYNEYINSKDEIKVEIDNVQLYNFLQKNGFYRFKPEQNSKDMEFIHIENSTVEIVEPNDIRSYIKKYLRSIYASKSIRNMAFNSPKLNDSSLMNLDSIDLSFVSYGRNHEMFFFKNGIVKITPDGIEKLKNGSVDCAVWKNKIKQHDIKIIDTPFDVKIKGRGDYDIEIHNDDCLFFKYLINSSRVHWRKELEELADNLSDEERLAYLQKNKFKINGPLLNQDEINEQKFHLINKLFAFGFMLHRYKLLTRGWMVLNMDGRISENQSHGGSGKSLLWDHALNQMKTKFFINGRDPEKINDKHKYDGMSEHIDYIFIEDANKYTKMEVLYNDITGSVAVNPKNRSPFTIPFKLAPKMVCTTNYAVDISSSSTARRLLFVEHSDYYHHKGADNYYREERSVEDDVDKILFGDDFSAEDWNNFYNTCFYALKFYLSCPYKISADQGNVYRRNLLKQMGGEEFKLWADLYFTRDKLNDFLQRETIQLDYKRENKEQAKFFKPGKFKSMLEAYCKFMDYELNPSETLSTKDGRILKYAYRKSWDGFKWVENRDMKISIEHFYIKADTEEGEKNTEDIDILNNAPEF